MSTRPDDTPPSRIAARSDLPLKGGGDEGHRDGGGETHVTRPGRLTANPGRLAENIVYFARVLRRAGLPVGPGAAIDALEAIQAAGLSTREDFYWTLHAVFVKRHEHSLVFDQAFRIFFQRRGYLEQLMALMSPAAPGASAAAAKPAAARVQEALFADAKDRLTREQRESEVSARLTASDEEVLRQKDFAQMSAAEIAAAKEAIKRLALSLHEVKTRRLAPDRRGHRIDLRRTLRASLQGGGALIDLKRRGPATRLPPIVALLDISGSMGEYTRLFLHFLHAVTDARKRVHSFLFGTRLTNVTRALKTKDPDEALAACSTSVADWAGGTRIATSLAAFNRLWGRRVLGQGAVVLLITDGLERDADDRLGFEIDRLHRSCRRLVWLNPLLRFAEFEPKAHGIQTMLPHVDELRALHNLNSMAGLVEALSEPRSRRTAMESWAKRVA
ncbi:MAG: VWA domain-containing protein [Rhodoplanes sp.]